ncbi:hypothetical protein N7462_003860 [Penicillium macrosclerotiorum]|uniref:uncharacterized protein n=1 Tax=Penicillium macrosclerotiorum TaxID=303699 RepID=UPI00254922EC|nr:uncharacterized protein N7462_003860 [Penicillium macrosclerotiorum]KAJ5689468.1 hypothetical protein N7462_003860 [Penicillium macrosclerotiorum]
MSTTVPEQHFAAVIPQKGGPLAIVQRPTPTPGPKELLLEVKAVAFNPVDYYQRETGLFLEDYPAIVGSDVAGTVIRVGPDVRADAPQVGTRVTAFASAWMYKWNLDYGAMQQYVLVSEDNIAVLPEAFSFAEGSAFPMAALVAWNGWLWAGIPQTPVLPGAAGVLVWGAASSMGAFAVQAARVMGYVVYATASPRNHAYIKELGASHVFDYKAESVVSDIVAAAKADGTVIRAGFHAMGEQQLSVDVMGQLRDGSEMVKLAIAPIVDEHLKVPVGVDTAFVQPPQDEEEIKERFRWIFGTWLQENLAAKKLVASPQVKVVEGGLESANKALDEWKAGVSAIKLVIEL